MEDSRRLYSIINKHSKAAIIIMRTPGIVKELKDYGVDAAKISCGMRLIGEVKGIVAKLQVERSEQLSYTIGYLVKMERAQKQYCKIVRMLGSLTNDNPSLMRIIPPALDAISPFDMLNTAFIFYSQLVEQYDQYSEALIQCGLTQRKLENEMIRLGEIGYLKLIRYRNLEDNYSLVVERDRKIEELIAFSKELVATANLALSHKQHLYANVTKFLS